MPARTPYTLTTADALATEVAQARLCGYAAYRRENELDIRCYGHAIVGAQGRVHGCISVSMPRYRFEEIPARSVIEPMRRCVASIAGATVDG